MSLRYYANAPATTLAATCSSSAGSISVTSATGYPIQYPFTVILDRGTATEEAVSVTSASGTTFNVVRAIDGTTAFGHSIGGTVEHGITAQDIRESNTHVNTNSGVHGVTGALVGTSDAQALTNKDLTSATNSFPSSLATDTELANHASAKTGVHGVGTGDIVGTTLTQSLSNKTFDFGLNTVSMTKAQLNTALTDADVATIAVAETLTNKTLGAGTLVGAATTDISAAWTPYTPTPANFTVGNGSLTGRYMQIGKTLHVRIYFASGSTSSYTASNASVSLPATAHASGQQALTAFMNDNVAGIGHILAGGNTVTPRFSASTSNPLLVGVQTTTFNPGTGTGGYFVIEGTYEVA